MHRGCQQTDLTGCNASQKKSCEWPKYSWRACEGSISLGIFHKNDAILRTWKNSKGPPSSHVSSNVWKEYTFIAKVKEMQNPIQWWSCVVVLCFVNILRNTVRAVCYTSHCPLSPLKNHPELCEFQQVPERTPLSSQQMSQLPGLSSLHSLGVHVLTPAKHRCRYSKVRDSPKLITDFSFN